MSTDTAENIIALDIYGTLVNPLEMDEHLKPLAGEEAPHLSALWRQKQLEYAFRRGLMDDYEDFGTVTAHALDFALESFDLDLDDETRKSLLAEYQNLRAFPDVRPGIGNLRASGYRVVAFSNGVEKTTRNLLSNAGISDLLDAVISTDDVKTFKPSPKVYKHLCTSLDRPKESICLVSSNPFDIIGAATFGLETAWLNRGSSPFDPWGISPGITATDLEELSGEITGVFPVESQH